MENVHKLVKPKFGQMRAMKFACCFCTSVVVGLLWSVHHFGNWQLAVATGQLPHNSSIDMLKRARYCLRLCEQPAQPNNQTKS